MIYNHIISVLLKNSGIKPTFEQGTTTGRTASRRHPRPAVLPQPPRHPTRITPSAGPPPPPTIPLNLPFFSGSILVGTFSFAPP